MHGIFRGNGKKIAVLRGTVKMMGNTVEMGELTVVTAAAVIPR